MISTLRRRLAKIAANDRAGENLRKYVEFVMENLRISTISTA